MCFTLSSQKIISVAIHLYLPFCQSEWHLRDVHISTVHLHLLAPGPQAAGGRRAGQRWPLLSRAAGWSINVLMGCFWFAASPRVPCSQPPKNTPCVHVVCTSECGALLSCSFHIITLFSKFISMPGGQLPAISCFRSSAGFSKGDLGVSLCSRCIEDPFTSHSAPAFDSVVKYDSL